MVAGSPEKALAFIGDVLEHLVGNPAAGTGAAGAPKRGAQ
jgi:hypothetical protein